jgi:hypothetical protein
MRSLCNALAARFDQVRFYLPRGYAKANVNSAAIKDLAPVPSTPAKGASCFEM